MYDQTFRCCLKAKCATEIDTFKHQRVTAVYVVYVSRYSTEQSHKVSPVARLKPDPVTMQNLQRICHSET